MAKVGLDLTKHCAVDDAGTDDASAGTPGDESVNPKLRYHIVGLLPLSFQVISTMQYVWRRLGLF